MVDSISWSGRIGNLIGLIGIIILICIYVFFTLKPVIVKCHQLSFNKQPRDDQQPELVISTSVEEVNTYTCKMDKYKLLFRTACWIIVITWMNTICVDFCIYWKLLVNPNTCTTFVKISYTGFVLGKGFLFTYIVLRLLISYHNTQFHNNQYVIILMFVMLTLYFGLLIAIVPSSLSGTYDTQCVYGIPADIFLIFLSFDIFFSTIGLILFLNPLRQLIKSSHIYQESFIKISIKYTLLTCLALTSGIMVVILYLCGIADLYGIEIFINCMCILFMTYYEYDFCYYFIFGKLHNWIFTFFPITQNNVFTS